MCADKKGNKRKRGAKSTQCNVLRRDKQGKGNTRRAASLLRNTVSKQMTSQQGTKKDKGGKSWTSPTEHLARVHTAATTHKSTTSLTGDYCAPPRSAPKGWQGAIAVPLSSTPSSYRRFLSSSSLPPISQDSPHLTTAESRQRCPRMSPAQ